MRHSAILELHKNLLISLIALLIGSAFLIINMNEFSMWLDEITFIQTAHHIHELGTYIKEHDFFSINPPLQMIAFNIWQGFVGHSDFTLRTLPVLTGIFTIALLIRISLDSIKDSFGGIATSLIFTSMGFARYHIHQVHSYSTFLMLTSLLIFSYLRWNNSKPNNWKYGFGIIISTTGLLYTHYYGAFVIIAINIHALHLFVKHPLAYKKWFLYQAISGFLYLPWIPSIIKLGNDFSSDSVFIPNTWAAITHELSNLLFNAPQLYVIIFILGTIFIITSKRTFNYNYIYFLASFLIVGLGTAIIFNTWLKTFADRRAIFLLIGIVLVSSYMITILPRKFGWLLLLATAVMALRAPIPPGMYGNWYIRQTIEFIKDEAKPHDFVFYQFSDEGSFSLRVPFPYYSDKLFPTSISYLLLGNHSLESKNWDYLANEVFAKELWPRDRFWVVRTQSDSPHPQPMTLDWISQIHARKFTHIDTYNIGFYILDLFEAAESKPQSTITDMLAEKDKLSLPQVFGNTFELLDYRLMTVGNQLDIELDWKAISPSSEDYALGIYLIDDNNNVHGQWDGDPTHWGMPTPTSKWIVDKIIYSQVTIENIPSGKYNIVMALYDRNELLRLDVYPFGETQLILTTIQIP